MPIFFTPQIGPRIFTFAVATMLALAEGSGVAQAADGNLDPTFGNGGKVITDFAGNSDYGSAVLLQPDGKIVSAGQSGAYPLFHSL